MGADQVQGIEHIQELVDFQIKNVSKSWKQLLDSQEIVLQCGDGRKGVPQAAPYKAIHVGAAAAVVPEDLLQQLDLNGRMVIPVGTYSQEIIIFDKDANGNIKKESKIGVRYVPLCDKSQQWP